MVVSIFIGIHLCLLSSCTTPPKTDMRRLAPAETLVYLESGDLGQMLQALTQNNSWENLAAEKPDFSQLENVQIAVAVTGFEASEKQVTDQSAVLNFKPNFVLIADTHAWNSTAVAIAENQIGKFAARTYGDDVKLEKSEKRGANFFVWTSADGRKLFAAVSESVIYVGNNKAVLDKCLSVKRSEAENLLKNENLVRARERVGDENRLAFGYVSPQGIGQIADLAGVSVAVESSEEDSVRSFVANALPSVLQKTAKEIVWTARRSEHGIEDVITIKTEGEVSSVFKETLVPAPDNQFQTAKYVPLQFDSITRYNLQNPQIAWRSVLLVASKQMDELSGKLLMRFSNSFFEPYGVSDGETFLSAVGAEIVTARFDEEGENSIVIAAVKDSEKIKKSISEEINFKAQPEKIGAADVWQSAGGESAAAFIEGVIILGEKKSVLNCLEAGESGKNFAQTIQFQQFKKESSVAATITKDVQTGQQIIGVLGKEKENKNTYTSFYTTETRFVENGIERKTTSDFGLIETITGKIGEGN